MKNLNKLWRNGLIILASTFIGFHTGGGYRLYNTQIEEVFVRHHHHQGEDLSTDIYRFIMLFILCGGAGAVAGAGISGLAIYATTKRKKS